MSTVISIRIRSEVKELLEEAGININYEVKKFLEDLAWKVRVKKNLLMIDEFLKNMPPTHRGFAVKSVREDRERR